MKLTNCLFSIKDVELLSIIKQKVSVSTVNSIWFIAEEKVLTFVTIATQKYDLTSYKR